MKAAELASALGSSTKVNRHYYAPCPVHEADSNTHRPSLAIADGRNGNVIVKCMAGCDQKEVVKALSDLGVWQHSKKDHPIVPSGDFHLASMWRLGMLQQLEGKLKTMGQSLELTLAADREPSEAFCKAYRLATRQRLFLRNPSLQRHVLVEAFNRAKKSDPEATRRTAEVGTTVYGEMTAIALGIVNVAEVLTNTCCVTT